MKLLLPTLFILCSIITIAQSPAKFKYQAVARNLSGEAYVNKTLVVRVSILEGAFNGTSVYSEEHSYTTNAYGLINITIGEGSSKVGQLSDVNWSADEYFLKTELDINSSGSFVFLGSSQLLSVPFAMHAQTVTEVDDADADPENELQTLSFSNNTISLTDGGSIDISTYHDSDADSTNELQVLSLSSDTLYLSDGGKVYIGDYLDNTDEQTLSINGNQISISGGNAITVTGTIDLDADPTNEIQAITISNDTVFLAEGGYVVLPPDSDDDSLNELQQLIISNDTIYLSDGNNIKLPEDADTDSVNEIQTLIIRDDTLMLSKEDAQIGLSRYKQSLSVSEDSLSISDGNTIKLPSLFPSGTLMFSESSNDDGLIDLGFELIGVEKRDVASIDTMAISSKEFFLVDSDYLFEFNISVEKNYEPIIYNGKIYLFGLGSNVGSPDSIPTNYIIDIETKEVSYMDTSAITLVNMIDFKSVLVGDEIVYWGGENGLAYMMVEE